MEKEIKKPEDHPIIDPTGEICLDYPISLDELIQAVTDFNSKNGAFVIDFVLRPNVKLNNNER